MAPLGIIVICYNSSAEIIALVKQLQQSDLPYPWEMAIIDNNSSAYDKSQLLRLEEYSFISLTFLNNNIGFGSACNVACEKLNAERYLFLNPDIQLKKNTIKQLYEYSMHSSAGIWGGLTIDKQGHADGYAAWPEPTVLKTFSWAVGLNRLLSHPRFQDNYRHLKIAENTASINVDAVSGCCLLINATLWQQLCGFDIQFFLYSEEIDLCKRARSLGYQPTMVTSAHLYHSRGTASISTNKRLEHLFKGKILYAKKHFSTPYFISYYCVCLLGALSHACIYSLSKNHSPNPWKNLIKKFISGRLSYD